MLRRFTLEYWIDDGWYVGKLKEVPGIFSQGESIDELEENIRDACQMMVADEEMALRGPMFTLKSFWSKCETASLHSRADPGGMPPEAPWRRPRPVHESEDRQETPATPFRDLKDSLCELIRKQLEIDNE